MSKLMKSAKPQRMWIDGNSFTILSKNRAQASTPLNAAEKYNVQKHDDGKYSTSFRLPSIYCSKICNPQYFAVDEFEKETNTKVELPQTVVGGSITVKGGSVTEVVDARNELHLLASDVRDSSPALQFVSIPVHSQEIKDNFIKFKEDVLSMDGIQGMHESIFQKPTKLHMTVAVFALQDDYEKAEAIKVLNDCRDVILNDLKKIGPLKVKVEGIDCMTGNLDKVNVLYGKPTFTDESAEVSLQEVANKIQDQFYERGLVTRYTDNVRLHVTLLNTKYRKGEASSPSPKKRHKWYMRKQPFSARKIMEKYKDFHFGESDFSIINLSLMHSLGDDGFYESLSSINLFSSD